MTTTNNNTPAPTTGVDNSNLDVLVPLPFDPAPIKYKGIFVCKKWDIEMKDEKPVKKDLVVLVALEKKNELDQPILIERRYNMLPRGRGVNDFKNDMASFLGYKIEEFPAKFLANQALIQLDGKPVVVAYRPGRGKHASHDRFLPATTPVEAPVEAAAATA